MWHRVIRQFQSTIIYILIFALAFALLILLLEGGHGWPFEATAIAVILLFNTVMGVWQEYRAEDAISKLAALAASRAWVVRDGEPRRIPVDEVVPGDIFRVEAGERIPADGMIVRSQGLLVEESNLTGESEYSPCWGPLVASSGAGALVVKWVAWGPGMAWLGATRFRLLPPRV